MKADIHPTYHQAKVTCACGNSFTVGSTETEIKVEICGKCHPFYTGTAKLIDTAGRVDKFKARLEKMQESSHPTRLEKNAKRKADKIEKTEAQINNS